MNYHLSFDVSLTPNTFSGKYFAFEGIDGSGKTTQVHKLAEYFQSQGKEVLLTKEPSDSEIGKLIKKILHKDISVPAATLQYLFAADRGMHLETDVIPALKNGTIVISDRSFWSAVAYGIADLLPRHSEPSGEESRLQRTEILRYAQDDMVSESDKERLLVAYNILTMYNGYIVPDKTFIIDVSENLAVERVENRHEEKTLYEYSEKLKKVRSEYCWIAERFSDNVVLVDGRKSVEEVYKNVVSSM